MADYDNLAELRQALNSDDRGRMLDAADTVRDARIDVDDVLSNDPPVQDLVDAGIIPAEVQHPPAAERWKEMIDLLSKIHAELKSGGGG